MTWITDLALRLGLGVAKWLGLLWIMGRLIRQRNAVHVAKSKDKQIQAALAGPRDKRNLVDRLRRDGL